MMTRLLPLYDTQTAIRQRTPGKLYQNNTRSTKNCHSTKTVSKTKLREINDRLALYDVENGPPGSTGKRIDLGWGRYEYPHRVEPDRNPKRMKKQQINDLICRLQTAKSQSTFDSPLAHEPHTYKHTKEDVNATVAKLVVCDHSRLPVGSSTNRQMLGFNRYDYGAYGDGQKAVVSRKVSKEELDEITDRLTKYDVNKLPPQSRGHEKK